MQVPQRFQWVLDVTSLAPLCDLPLRSTDAEVVEENGRKLIVVHGFDPSSDATLVDEGSPEQFIVPVGAMEVSIKLASGQSYATHIHHWAPKPVEPAEQPVPMNRAQRRAKRKGGGDS